MWLLFVSILTFYLDVSVEWIRSCSFRICNGIKTARTVAAECFPDARNECIIQIELAENMQMYVYTSQLKYINTGISKAGIIVTTAVFLESCTLSIVQHSQQNQVS